MEAFLKKGLLPLSLFWLLVLSSPLFPLLATQYQKETLKVLEAAGPLKLLETTVTERLDLQGTLVAEGARIASLSVAGEAQLSRTTVSGSAAVIGFLKASESTFEGPLVLTAPRAVFSKSTLLGPITVRPNALLKGKQILELRPGTRAEGPIHFESGQGEVRLWPGAYLLAPVTGGKAIKS